jgi:hypothetical protein
MLIERRDAVFRWMCAWVRLHAKGSIREWNPIEVSEAFSILPPPPVGIEDFLAAAGYEVAKLDRDQVNENAANILAGVGSRSVKVEDHAEQQGTPPR